VQLGLFASAPGLLALFRTKRALFRGPFSERKSLIARSDLVVHHRRALM
jgi:hypothetical protein